MGAPFSTAPAVHRCSMIKNSPQARYDIIGKIVLMAEADGYVMVRRPRCIPMVMPSKKWLSLSREPVDPPAKKEIES